jgi:hypothetical protein
MQWVTGSNGFWKLFRKLGDDRAGTAQVDRQGVMQQKVIGPDHRAIHMDAGRRGTHGHEVRAIKVIGG